MTGAGKPFTAHRVRSLRNHHKIPPATLRTPPPPGTERVTVARAASELGVSTATVHRWLREGFIIGEQMTRHAPWQIPITPELRARVRQHAPDGWLPLTDAANALGLARQTVLHKVQRAASSPRCTSNAGSEKACSRPRNRFAGRELRQAARDRTRTTATATQRLRGSGGPAAVCRGACVRGGCVCRAGHPKLWTLCPGTALCVSR